MNSPLPGVWSHALELSQEYGLACFALADGAKVPRHGTNGVLDATTHPERIIEWANLYPRANYGIACGGWLNLYVLDFDRLEVLAAFTERFGIRPPTPTARTPKPGRHEYYLAPAGIELRNTAGKLAPGVDTRGHGGYVVGPFSTLADGRDYAPSPGLSPADVDFAPLPDAIIAALLTPSRPAAPPRPLAIVRRDGDITARVAGYLRTLPALRDGEGRNQTGYRLAAFVLNDCAGSASDAWTALSVWNNRNIEPLADDRLHTIVANAGRYGGAKAA